MMKLAISAQALAHLPLEKACEVLCRHDVRYIELWPENLPWAGAEGISWSYVGRDLARTKDILARAGILPACVTFSGAFVEALRDDPVRYSAELCAAIQAAHALGARIVNHYCYYLAPEKPDFARLTAFWAEAATLARELGVTLALENEAHDATAHPDGTRAILDGMKLPALGTNFDAANYYHGSSEAFPLGYLRLRDKIAYIHVKNACQYVDGLGYLPRRAGAEMGGVFAPQKIYYPLCCAGAVNIDGLLTMAAADGYDGFVTLEPHVPAEDLDKYYTADLAYLRGRHNFER